VLALSASEGGPPVDAQGRGTLSGIVTHVANGDTLDITANGTTYTIRLDGIDAPEGGQAFGREARQHLRVLAFSKAATAAVRDRDRYGRTVARVIVAGRDLSEEMVKAGLAWHFVRYSSDRRLAALEQEARQQRRGLWADRSAVPPWQYRSDRGAAPNVTPPPRPPAAPLSAGPYHGNVSSGVYHAAGCPGLQLPQLHASVLESPGGGGRRLSSA
jgi:endonuclease YncB( thermonuclease family)